MCGVFFFYDKFLPLGTICILRGERLFLRIFFFSINLIVLYNVRSLFCLFVLLRVKKASNTGFDLLLLRVLNAPRLLRLVCGKSNKKTTKTYAVPTLFSSFQFEIH